MSQEEHVIEWLPAYALGSLDLEERGRVGAHLATCPLCQKELLAYQVVVEQLPLAVPQQTPPSRLRQAILNRVSVQPAGKPESAAAAVRKPTWLERLRQALLLPVPAWGLVALFLLLIGLLAGNLFLLQRNQDLAAGSAGDFQVVRMVGTSAAAAANGWIVISQDGEAGTLIVQDLPPLSDDHQYQLWLVKDGERSSGGVFSVDEKGYASVWVYSHEPLSDYQQFGITIEPYGGSPGPTGSKVLGSL